MAEDAQSAVLARPKIKARALIIIGLVFLTAYLPMVIHLQFITGPLVNMSLILALFLLGPFEAVLLGLMPSVLALTSGLLPLPLAPVVPFIMISNAILVGVYHYFGRKSFGVSVFAAAFLKFIFLYGVTGLIVSFLLKGSMASIVAGIMGWVQFGTAVVGGALAYIVLFFIRGPRPDRQTSQM